MVDRLGELYQRIPKPVRSWTYRLALAGLMLGARDGGAASAQESLKGGLRLPFSGKWALSGGPHGTFNNRVWNGLDFVPFNESIPCPGGRFKGQWEARASAPGTVSVVNRGEGYAKVDHGDLTTGYMHLVEIVVNKDQSVNGGDVIGKIGCIGRTSGGHLHWFIERAGRPISIEGMIVGDKRIESFGNEYQGKLVGEDGAEVIADVSRCDNIDRCGFRNDLTENYWELPVTGPGPKPAPRPTIEIGEIIIIPNTPTPEPTSTPTPLPTPREIPPLELGCVMDRYIYRNLDRVKPEDLSFMGIDMAIESYKRFLCSTQGSLNNKEGRLMMGAFQLSDWNRVHLDLRWESSVPIGELEGKTLYGVVSGQAEIGDRGPGARVSNGVVPRSVWGKHRERLNSHGLRLRSIFDVRPDYRYRVRVGARTEEMENFDLPGGDYSDWILHTANPDYLVGILIEIGMGDSWRSEIVDIGQRIVFPIREAQRLHELVSTKTGEPGYSQHELLRCPPPRGCPP